MGIKFTNNASATLAASINSTVTSISVTTGQGARFPTLAAGDYFFATLVDSSNNLEIIKVTNRVTDTMTIVRAQDGTTGRSFLANDRIELRPVAAAFTALQEFTPSGTISANTLAGAIVELDSEKAALASPAFTGTPTVPTATAGTNTTQAASTAFVTTAITNERSATVAITNKTINGSNNTITNVNLTSGAGVTGTLPVANGGTGSDATYTNGQLLIGNTTGGTLTKATLTAGTGVSITNGAGSITVGTLLGPNAQVFTTVGNNQPFTIPTGITRIKVTVVGGGGGSSYGSGTAGGTSSVASNTQSITTVQATGGTASYSGGLGSNGDLNLRGGRGFDTVALNASYTIPGGSSFISPFTGLTTNTYGVGGVGVVLPGTYGPSVAPGGGGGGTAIKWLTGLTPGNTLSVSVGAGGTNGVSSSYNGTQGIVIIEW